MLTLTEIFSIIVIHWFADFIMQDERWALCKSKELKALLKHTFTYSIIWLIIGLFIFPIINVFIFFLITFIIHTITDYHTSRITSKLYEKRKFGSRIPNIGFFSMIGFDQVLHYIQLFITYYYLKQ